MRKRSGAIDAHVGRRIRLRRTLMGVSQTTLGRAVGLTFQQIQKYERGVNQLSAARLYQFAGALNVPLAYFFEEIEGDGATGTGASVDALNEPPQTGFGHEGVVRRETLELVRAYYSIENGDLRNRIRELIENIADNSESGKSS